MIQISEEQTREMLYSLTEGERVLYMVETMDKHIKILKEKGYIKKSKLEEETWKDIKEYKGYYQVSNLGRIKSLKRIGRKENKILLPALNMNGYNTIALSKNNKMKTHRVNRLVALSFIENPENKLVVHHKDRDKLNDNVDNLEWVTYSENTRHAVVDGIQYVEYGEDSRFAKLTNKQVKKVRGDLWKMKADYIKKMASIYCVTGNTIRSIINNETYIDITNKL